MKDYIKELLLKKAIEDKEEAIEIILQNNEYFNMLSDEWFERIENEIIEFEPIQHENEEKKLSEIVLEKAYNSIDHFTQKQ